MPQDDDLPPGFQRISGKRKPPVGWRGYIALRCGFVDTRVIYERDHLNFIHDGSCGDIIAVKGVVGNE
ncbi:hypothetical protein [Tsuneonella sp. HG222]